MSDYERRDSYKTGTGVKSIPKNLQAKGPRTTTPERIDRKVSYPKPAFDSSSDESEPNNESGTDMTQHHLSFEQEETTITELGRSDNDEDVQEIRHEPVSDQEPAIQYRYWHYDPKTRIQTLHEPPEEIVPYNTLPEKIQKRIDKENLLPYYIFKDGCTTIPPSPMVPISTIKKIEEELEPVRAATEEEEDRKDNDDSDDEASWWSRHKKSLFKASRMAIKKWDEKYLRERLDSLQSENTDLRNEINSLKKDMNPKNDLKRTNSLTFANLTINSLLAILTKLLEIDTEVERQRQYGDSIQEIVNYQLPEIFNATELSGVIKVINGKSIQDTVNEMIKLINRKKTKELHHKSYDKKISFIDPQKFDDEYNEYRLFKDLRKTKAKKA